MYTLNSRWRTRAAGTVAGLALVGIGGAVAAPAHAASLPTVLQKIRYCESGNNYTAVNASSGASGAYQFLTSTWQGLSAAKGYSTAASAPASVQDAAALELYSQAGTSPWAASQSCWASLGSVPSGSTNTSGTGSTTTTSSSTSSTSSSSATTSRSTTRTSVQGKAVNRAKAKPAPKKPGTAPVGGHHHHRAAPPGNENC